jgi:two-component system, cell cycle sensor histidine kinase and response regulator CckA
MKDRFRTFLDSIRDYIFVLQADKTVFANISALKLLNIRNPNNLDEIDFFCLFPSEESERIKYNLHHSDKNWEFIEDRLTINKDPSTKISVACKISRLTYQNQEYFVFQLIDISNIPINLIKPKETIYKNRELIKTNSLKNISAGISHNFNNALASMSLAIETLRLFTDRTPKANELLDKIINISHKMSKWTNQLLCYAKGGKYIIKLCNINESIVSSLEQLNDSTPNWVIISHELSDDLNLIKADPAQMEEIFIEIIQNSVESIKDTGRIEILTRNLPKNSQLNRKTKKFINRPCVYASISDTGCGMNQDVIEQVFEPFFSTKFQGRGLGLSAVWGIIENHEGEIIVESFPGKGTKFEIFLALPEEAESQTEQKKEHPKKIEEKKVVVISEDENNRFIIKTLLENYGYTVYSFSRQEELYFSLKSSIDLKLIYLDQSSFRKEEFEKIYPLLSSKPDTKILISLNYSNKEIAEKVSGQKNIKIIYRPFKYEEIVDVLRTLLKM